MSQPFVTGPVWIYCGVGSLATKAPLFLGTSEKGPEIHTLDGWEPLINTIGGTKLPSDQAFQGEDHLVRATLNKFNYNVLHKILRKGNFDGVAGTQDFGDTGAMMLTEGLAYPLWLRFPYQVKAAYSTMPVGRKYLASWVISPTQFQDLGTLPKKISIIWYCQRVFFPSTGGHTLYNFDMTGLPAID